MYVIEVTVPSDGTPLTFNSSNNGISSDDTVHIAIVPAGESHVFPADRCIWRVSADDNGGYHISEVFYQTGAGLLEQLDVNASNGSGASNNTCRFGVIGKSGRFVAFSDQL